MQPARWMKNTLFAIIILLIVISLDRADLPATQRVEEYIAFVLSTDFTFTGLSQKLHQVEDQFNALLQGKWSSFVQWLEKLFTSSNSSSSTLMDGVYFISKLSFLNEER